MPVRHPSCTTSACMLRSQSVPLLPKSDKQGAATGDYEMGPVVALTARLFPASCSHQEGAQGLRCFWTLRGCLSRQRS